MEYGIVSQEFYIGRFLYLTSELDKLPKITHIKKGDGTAMSIRWKDADGTDRRHRLTAETPELEEFKKMELRRAILQEKLDKLLASWKMEHGGSLKDLAAGYVLKPNTTNPYDSSLYESLKEDNNSYPKNRHVIHNGMVMRSFFEADVAQVLEDLGIDYKYEVCFRFGNNGDMSPDFSMNFPEFNRCGFLEAVGGMNNFSYINSNSEKFANYANAGLVINRDIIYVAGEGDYRPDHGTIRRIIGVMLDALAKQFVFRKT